MSDVIENVLVVWWKEITQMTNWLKSERWPQCPNKLWHLNDCERIRKALGLSPTWSTIWQDKSEPVSNNDPSKDSRKQLLPFNILDQEYGSCHGKVINQTKKLFSNKIGKQSDIQAKKLLGLSD